MSQTSTGDMGRSGGKSSAKQRRGPFARSALFFRQVMAELRKVVRPTRNELVTYTVAALIFVSVVMAFVFFLDLLFGKLVLWVFSAS